MVAVMRSTGGDVDRFIKRHDLPADIEANPDALLSIAVLQKACDDAAVQLGDEYLGLHLAQIVPRGAFGILEFMMRSASTVRHLCELGIRYSGLINELSEIRLEERDGEAIYWEQIPGEPSCGGRQSNEFIVAALVRLVREASGHTLPVRRISFAHRAPNDRALDPLVAFFGTSHIEFDGGCNRICIASEDLARPLRSADPALLATLEKHAAALIQQRPPPGDALTLLRDRIVIALREKRPLRLDAMARSLRMSPRSLQRLIVRQETTFHRLVDEVRASLAISYLAQEQLSLAEIADRIGYGDLRAFVRAFKRWTRTTPGGFRARARRD